jgi:hypothetical protein
MSNTGNFNDGRTPTWNTAATGTPTGNPDGVNPFAWTAGEGASAPLSTPLSQQFANEAHKAVHDEVMKVCAVAPPLHALLAGVQRCPQILPDADK